MLMKARFGNDLVSEILVNVATAFFKLFFFSWRNDWQWKCLADVNTLQWKRSTMLVMWTNPNYGEPFSGSRKDTIVEDQQRWKKAL